ncbi:MAG: type II toxin-antitoxin system death-on-curing family toxin [Myxococcales bacterium]|nr:type II toxin-antitoxin system death-on-curing family toxin [Myxococcales bacterium]
MISAGPLLAYYCDLLGVAPSAVPARSIRCVEGSVDNALQGAMYSTGAADLEDLDVLTVAAFALYYLARNHCFPDGNKRIAFLACQRTLAQGGFRLHGSDDDLVHFVEAVARGDFEPKAIARWIGDRLVGMTSS